MVISQPTGNNSSYYYRFTNVASNCLNASRDTLCSMACNYNIRVTHRNGAIKHIFTRIRSTVFISRLFFIHFVAHALALHLAVKILLQIFLYEDLHWPYIHLSVVFPSRMPAGPHFVTQPILLSETFLIFDINHQQNTRRSGPD